MNYFAKNFLLGFKYAGYFIVIAALMGAIYGVFGGRIISPMFVGVAYLGIFVLLNLPFAIIAGFINIFPSLFKKGRPRMTRYVAMSLSFSMVFLSYFLLIKYSGIQVF